MDLLNLRNYYYITYSTGTENEVILKINNIYKSVLLYIIRKGVVLFDSISVKHQMPASPQSCIKHDISLPSCDIRCYWLLYQVLESMPTIAVNITSMTLKMRVSQKFQYKRVLSKFVIVNEILENTKDHITSYKRSELMAVIPKIIIYYRY